MRDTETPPAPFIVSVGPLRADSIGGQRCEEVEVHYRTDRGVESCVVSFFDGDVWTSADDALTRDQWWEIVEAAEVVRDGGIWGTDFPLDAVNAEIVIASAETVI